MPPSILDVSTASSSPLQLCRSLSLFPDLLYLRATEDVHSPAVVASALKHFQRTSHTSAFAILAYCVMPDHVHLLVEGTTSNSDLVKFVKRLKQSSGQAYSGREKQRLWQEGYHDRVLRPTDDAKTIARYIVANPVGGGLALSPADYPYVGSDVWSLNELIESIR